MLDRITPFPAEFAARYRDRGRWADRPLFDGFTGALARYADRVALVDGQGPVTHRRLALPRIGAVPVLALPGHRKREITQKDLAAVIR